MLIAQPSSPPTSNANALSFLREICDEDAAGVSGELLLNTVNERTDGDGDNKVLGAAS
jgi:hypothetical protein